MWDHWAGPLVVRYVSLLSWSLYLFHVYVTTMWLFPFLMNTIQPKKRGIMAG